MRIQTDKSGNKVFTAAVSIKIVVKRRVVMLELSVVILMDCIPGDPQCSFELPIVMNQKGPVHVNMGIWQNKYFLLCSHLESNKEKQK